MPKFTEVARRPTAAAGPPRRPQLEVGTQAQSRAGVARPGNVGPRVTVTPSLCRRTISVSDRAMGRDSHRDQWPGRRHYRHAGDARAASDSELSLSDTRDQVHCHGSSH